MTFLPFKNGGFHINCIIIAIVFHSVLVSNTCIVVVIVFHSELVSNTRSWM